jgi:aminobenzoyl-glutamate utilization protein B
MTTLDLLLEPELLEAARAYFAEVQTKDVQYDPFEGPQDMPAVDLNAETQAEFSEAVAEYYYVPSRFDTYLEQLGVDYPTVE